jgi:hypothetical protein
MAVPVGPNLPDQIGQAADLVGLLLALITLFTSDRADRLREERGAEGGPKRQRVRAILGAAVGLASVTLVAVISLLSLAHKGIDALFDGSAGPVVSVFLLVWVLLIALVVWQVLIVTGAIRLYRSSS